MYSFQGSGAHAGGFPQMGNAEAIAAAFAGGLPPGISGTNDRCTILVSNLDSDVSFCSLSQYEYQKTLSPFYHF